MTLTLIYVGVANLVMVVSAIIIFRSHVDDRPGGGPLVAPLIGLLWPLILVACLVAGLSWAVDALVDYGRNGR